MSSIRNLSDLPPSIVEILNGGKSTLSATGATPMPTPSQDLKRFSPEKEVAPSFKRKINTTPMLKAGLTSEQADAIVEHDFPFDMARTILYYSADEVTFKIPNDDEGFGLRPREMTRKKRFTDEQICEVLRCLLEAGISPNEVSHPGIDETCLHLAAFHGHEKTVQLLLEKKADPNIGNGFNTPIYTANTPKMMDLLVAHYAYLTQKDYSGRMPIEYFKEAVNADIAMRYAMASFVDRVNSLSSAGYKKLQTHIQVMQHKREDGTKDEDHPLNFVEEGYEENVKRHDERTKATAEKAKLLYRKIWELTNNEAKKREEEKKEILETAAKLAESKLPFDSARKYFYESSENFRDREYKILWGVTALIDKKADPNEVARPSIDRTFLHAAVEASHLNVVQLLLDNKADPKIRTETCTPLHVASLACITESLLKHGADPTEIDVNAETPEERISRNSLVGSGDVSLNAQASRERDQIIKSFMKNRTQYYWVTIRERWFQFLNQYENDFLHYMENSLPDFKSLPDSSRAASFRKMRDEQLNIGMCHGQVCALLARSIDPAMQSKTMSSTNELKTIFGTRAPANGLQYFESEMKFFGELWNGIRPLTRDEINFCCHHLGKIFLWHSPNLFDRELTNCFINPETGKETRAAVAYDKLVKCLLEEAHFVGESSWGMVDDFTVSQLAWVLKQIIRWDREQYIKFGIRTFPVSHALILTPKYFFSPPFRLYPASKKPSITARQIFQARTLIQGDRYNEKTQLRVALNVYTRQSKNSKEMSPPLPLPESLSKEMRANPEALQLAPLMPYGGAILLPQAKVAEIAAQTATTQIFVKQSGLSAKEEDRIKEAKLPFDEARKVLYESDKQFTDDQALQVCSHLISMKIDPNQAAHPGVEPSLLHSAVNHNHQKTVALLLQHKANLDMRDKAGNTPLHYANHKNMVQLLVNHKADVAAENCSGETPVQVVARRAPLRIEQLCKDPNPLKEAELKQLMKTEQKAAIDLLNSFPQFTHVLLMDRLVDFAQQYQLAYMAYASSQGYPFRITPEFWYKELKLGICLGLSKIFFERIIDTHLTNPQSLLDSAQLKNIVKEIPRTGFDYFKMELNFFLNWDGRRELNQSEINLGCRFLWAVLIYQLPTLVFSSQGLADNILNRRYQPDFWNGPRWSLFEAFMEEEFKWILDQVVKLNRAQVFFIWLPTFLHTLTFTSEVFFNPDKYVRCSIGLNNAAIAYQVFNHRLRDSSEPFPILISIDTKHALRPYLPSPEILRDEIAKKRAEPRPSPAKQNDNLSAKALAQSGLGVHPSPAMRPIANKAPESQHAASAKANR